MAGFDHRHPMEETPSGPNEMTRLALMAERPGAGLFVLPRRADREKERRQNNGLKRVCNTEQSN